MPTNKLRILGVGLFLFFPLASAGYGLEKVKISTAIRGQPLFILPPIAAQEKGFWREEGLEGEWVSFVSGALQAKAMVAGDVAIAITTTGAAVGHASRGVPLVIAADIGGFQPWWLWVREASPIKEVKDLKGARFALTRIGDLDHAYARAIIKGLGQSDKDMKFIGMGGIVEMLAGLRAGAADAVVLSEFTMARLEADRVARKLVPLSRFVPEDWDPLTVSATRAFVETSPEVLRRVIRATLKAGLFIVANPEWSIQKIRSEIGHPQPVAEKVYKLMGFSKDGKIYPERIKNVREFMINYGLVSAEKTPPLEALYTEKFVPIR